MTKIYGLIVYRQSSSFKLLASLDTLSSKRPIPTSQLQKKLASIAATSPSISIGIDVILTHFHSQAKPSSNIEAKVVDHHATAHAT
jgi:hypothetical protein